MGTEFQLCHMMLCRSVSQQCDEHYWAVRFKRVKMVNFMSCCLPPTHPHTMTEVTERDPQRVEDRKCLSSTAGSKENIHVDQERQPRKNRPKRQGQETLSRRPPGLLPNFSGVTTKGRNGALLLMITKFYAGFALMRCTYYSLIYFFKITPLNFLMTV